MHDFSVFFCNEKNCRDTKSILAIDSPEIYSRTIRCVHIYRIHNQSLYTSFEQWEPYLPNCSRSSGRRSSILSSLDLKIGASRNCFGCTPVVRLLAGLRSWLQCHTPYNTTQWQCFRFAIDASFIILLTKFSLSRRPS